jgi:hypothetical protein
MVGSVPSRVKNICALLDDDKDTGIALSEEPPCGDMIGGLRGSEVLLKRLRILTMSSMSTLPSWFVSAVLLKESMVEEVL